jgi:hypothetical protein
LFFSQKRKINEKSRFTLFILDTSLPDDKYSTIRYSYNWQPIYSSQKSPSPKLYTLVKHIRTANLQKELFIKQQSIDEDENEIEMKSTAELDQLPQVWNAISF